MSNYTIAPNELVNDPALSWKAKGIFLYLASKPDSWDFYMSDIKQHATDGKTALKSGVKELEKAGYLTRKRDHDGSGQFDGWKWTLTTPSSSEKIPDDPAPTDKQETRQTENPTDGKSDSRETGPYSNTKDSKTKDSNTELSKVATRTDDATQLSDYLLEAIKRNNPDHKFNFNPPATDKWIKELEKGLRLDMRTVEQFKYMIDYVFGSPDGRGGKTDVAIFWSSNIQSGDKLRSKFDTIAQQIKREKRHAQIRNKKPDANKIDQQLDKMYR